LNIADVAGLEYCTKLHYLCLYLNHISDILPLADRAMLRQLHIYDNQISDSGPLVQNEGLGTGGYIRLSYNPLSSDSINIYILQLEASEC
jgi:hypothetical protein